MKHKVFIFVDRETALEGVKRKIELGERFFVASNRADAQAIVDMFKEETWYEFILQIPGDSITLSPQQDLKPNERSTVQ